MGHGNGMTGIVSITRRKEPAMMPLEAGHHGAGPLGRVYFDFGCAGFAQSGALEAGPSYSRLRPAPTPPALPPTESLTRMCGSPVGCEGGSEESPQPLARTASKMSPRAMELSNLGKIGFDCHS
jgi:hypothetical protein